MRNRKDDDHEPIVKSELNEAVSLNSDIEFDRHYYWIVMVRQVEAKIKFDQLEVIFEHLAMTTCSEVIMVML